MNRVMTRVRSALRSTGRFLGECRNWEENEDFFCEVKKQLTEFGDFEYLRKFDLMENYIRWKGKEDAAKHAGKSMLRMILA